MLQSLRLFALLLTLSFLFSCGSTKDINTGDVETVFKEAVRLFNEEDYLDAKKYFDVIKLQYPSSQYADDAQYYVAEIDYKRGDYVLASYNYNRLRTSYPSSEYVTESLFKAALSYYQLSPPYDRDQEYTYKGIEAFNLFQRLYPNDNKYADAGDYIKELREKLAHREYFTAELYRKMREPSSSLVYYQEVIDDYPDSQYYEPAYVGKIEVLTLLRRYDEARGLIDLYKRIFVEGKMSTNVSTIESTIPAK
jgi:outer membrane protein assembly factor BamD